MDADPNQTLPTPDETGTFSMLRTAVQSGLSPEQALQLQRAEADESGYQAAILVVDDDDPMRMVLMLTLRALATKTSPRPRTARPR